MSANPRPWTYEKSYMAGGRPFVTITDANGNDFAYLTLWPENVEENAKLICEEVNSALSPLVSKPDAIDCLINLEWAGETDVDGGGVEPSCPWCDVPKSVGVHSWVCKLALLIDARREDVPADDHPADGRFTR